MSGGVEADGVPPSHRELKYREKKATYVIGRRKYVTKISRSPGEPV